MFPSECSADVSAFATDANVPHVVWRDAYPYALQGSTVIDGQVVGYDSSPSAEILCD
jgi:hypothetical protein